MIRLCIGGAVICGLIALMSTVMAFVRIEQWSDFICIAGGGCIGVIVMLLGLGVVLQDLSRDSGG